MKNTKSRLLDKLNEQLDFRINEIERSMQSAKESRDSDTKSSAGDKYETGREMIQQELDKYEGQLIQTRLLRNKLLKINPQKKYNQAEFGSLLICNSGNYFLSVALGKLVFDGDDFICLSMASPLGKSFNGKLAGDEFVFNGKRTVIEEIY